LAKPVKSSLFLLTKTPEISIAGVKNHHLEIKSTSPQFFARADFDLAGPFWGQLTAVSAADAMAKPPKNNSKTPCAASKAHSASLGARHQNQRLQGLKALQKLETAGC
jgi:hypothetical protein